MHGSQDGDGHADGPAEDEDEPGDEPSDAPGGRCRLHFTIRGDHAGGGSRRSVGRLGCVVGGSGVHHGTDERDEHNCDQGESDSLRPQGRVARCSPTHCRTRRSMADYDLGSLPKHANPPNRCYYSQCDKPGRVQPAGDWNRNSLGSGGGTGGDVTMQRGRRGLRLLLVAMVVVAVAGVSSPASAHRGDQSYLYLDVTPSQLTGRIEVPIRDLNQALGLELGGSDDEVLAGLSASVDVVRTYLEAHVEIGAIGSPWPITLGKGSLFFSELAEADDNYVVFPFSVATAGPVPRQLEVRFDPFFDEIEGRDALLLIGNDWEAGVIDNGSTALTTFDPGARTQSVDLGETDRFRNFTESAKLGVNHIRTGPDHILFVLVLLLPSVLVFTTRWEPAASFSASLWRVLKIVTTFTLAHSITFTAAGLEVLPLPPSRVVESVIAGSITVAALHNLRPVAANKEWLIAFIFGLFHGMGFASLVSGLDVDQSTQLISLLGRNAGIEIGQAVVVLLVFPSLFLLRRTRYFAALFWAVSLLMVAVSLVWMFERIYDIDVGITALVEPVVAWPGVLFYLVPFTLAAAGLHYLEDLNHRLQRVEQRSGSFVGFDTDEHDIVG